MFGAGGPPEVDQLYEYEYPCVCKTCMVVAGSFNNSIAELEQNQWLVRNDFDYQITQRIEPAVYGNATK